MKTKLHFALEKEFEGEVNVDLMYKLLGNLRNLTKDQARDKDSYALLFRNVEPGSTRFVFTIHQVEADTKQLTMKFDEHVEEDDNIALRLIELFKLLNNPNVSEEFIKEFAQRYDLSHITSAFSTIYTQRCGFYIEAFDEEGKLLDKEEFSFGTVDQVHYKLKQYAKPKLKIVTIEAKVVGATIADKKLQLLILSQNDLIETGKKVWIKYDDCLHEDVLSNHFKYNDEVITSVEIKPNKHKKILNMIHKDESKRLV